MRIEGVAASALNAFSVDMAVRANNIANVNTREFQSQNPTLTTGPHGKGVDVAAIHKNTQAGPRVPGLVMVDENGRETMRPGFVEGSNTDVAREFVSMIAAQRAYEANAAMIRASDELSGALLDTMV